MNTCVWRQRVLAYVALAGVDVWDPKPMRRLCTCLPPSVYHASVCFLQSAAKGCLEPATPYYTTKMYGAWVEE